MLIQIPVTLFKPSGKYYTDDFCIIKASFNDGVEIPLYLDGYTTYDLIKEYFNNKNAYTGMWCLPKHDLLVPALIKL